jgi:hypothetical protein
MVWLLLAGAALGDDFDRLEGTVLANLPGGDAVQPCPRLTLDDIARLPNVFPGVRSTPLIVQTDQGHLARLLVAPAFRTSPGAADEPMPVFVLDRFATFEMPGALNQIARGRNLTLFDGFRLDLDTGQVVPEGQGEDLQLLAGGPEPPRLVPVGPARLFTLPRSPWSDRDAAPKPSATRIVQSSDFSGRYRLFANGQWTGTLDLQVRDGDVVGRFRSDQTGRSYPVSGETGSPAHRIRFTVRLPRTEQDYEGYLFSEGKGAIAGVTSLLARPFGFFAIREGGTIVPEGEEVDLVAPSTSRPGRLVVELEAEGRFLLEGRSIEAEALTHTLQQAIGNDPETWVLLVVPPDRSFASVTQAIAEIRRAGIDLVRLASPSPQPTPEAPR